MAITPLPPAPEPTDSTAEFNTKAFAWVASLDNFTTEANALATGADTDASTATTQAGIATTQAGISTTQAGIATTQAGISTTQAGIATTKAGEALASANAAAASYDQFDDRYLGSKTSDPSLDNDGNALLNGALYFNSVANEMRVYNGASWQSPSVVGGTVASINVTGATTLAQDPTISSGTANGVAYLNGSKVLTTGSALTFDGGKFAVSASVLSEIRIADTGSATDQKNWTWQYGTGVGAGLLRLRAGNDANSDGQNAYIVARTGINVDSHQWLASGSEQMRLTSTGLGIGTSSPSEKLTVAGAGLFTGNLSNYRTSSLALDFFSGASRIWAFGANASTAGTLQLHTASNDGSVINTLTYNSSGNLGLGVTPSAWSQGVAFEIKDKGYGLWNGTASIYSIANAYFDSGFKYAHTGAAASHYYQFQGAHVWSTAPSGTAGNAISFTQAMTLDASGRLGIGTTSPSQTLNVNGISLFEGSAQGNVIIQKTGTNGVSLFSDAAGKLAFYDQNAAVTRMILTATGEFITGGTTDQGAYNLQCNGTGVWGAGAYVNGSDARIKEDVAPIRSGLDIVEKLNPVTYRYKEDWSKDQSVQTGFIAQELLTALDGEVYVDGVVQQGGEYMSVAYQNLIPVLTKAIQELKAEFDAYKLSHP